MLIENKERGHSDSFAPVRIAGAAKSEIIDAVITGRDDNHLIGMRV